MKFLSKFFKIMFSIFAILMVLCLLLIAIYLIFGEATTIKVLETSYWIVNTIRKNLNKMCYNKYGLRDIKSKETI